MPLILFSNNASGALASSITTAATTITLTTGAGAQFPAISGGNYFYATLTDASNNLEIVKVTARASDVLTVVRAQEGTIARAYAAADKLELRVTAVVMESLVQVTGDQAISGTKTFASAPVFSTPLAVTSGGSGVSTATGSGNNVLSNSPTLVTPALGTPSAVVLTNASGTAASLTAGAAQQLTTTNWTVLQSGTALYFQYSGVSKMRLDSNGTLNVAGDIIGLAGTV
jgi:hypothetical protein